MTRKAPDRISTEAEGILRVDKVSELLVKGLTRREIISYIEKKTDWNIASRTVDTLISKAKDRFKLDSEVDKETERALAAGRFQLLYEMAIKVQDIKAAIAAEWKRCELLGLPAEKTQNLRLLGVEPLVFSQWLDTLQAHDLKPSDVFGAMIQELADAKRNERE